MIKHQKDSIEQLQKILRKEAITIHQKDKELLEAYKSLKIKDDSLKDEHERLRQEYKESKMRNIERRASERIIEFGL